MPDRLEAAWDALRAGRWEVARAQFTAALAVREAPEALEGLSWAAWWLDDAKAMFEARERAFHGYRDCGDLASAARMAAWLAADHLDFHGALTSASGWLDRAQRLLEPLEPTPDHGWVAFHRGFIADIRGQTSDAEADAVLASDIGRKFGVPDLEMLGLALQGMTLVCRAKVQDGMRCLDEATAMALAGEATIPISAAWTCCFLVTSCSRVLDFERALEWCDRIAAFAARYGSRYMLGFCLAEYADVYLWRGEWPEAEKSLESSLAAYEASRPAMADASLVLLAELRRRQGRIDESHRLLDRAGMSANSQLCRARLALDARDAGNAIDLGQRALRNVPVDRSLDRVPILDFLARAHIYTGDLDTAGRVLGELQEVVTLIGTRALTARTMLVEGMLAAASGDHSAAQLRLEDAVDGFELCRAPYEASLARIELATTLASLGRLMDAQREWKRANECLRRLGANADIRRTQQLLDADAKHEFTRPLLSRREAEVLHLLAQGLTNRQIAERLVISEHTVHRHVTNILRKLDVPSRAAAAAHAVRIGLLTHLDQ